MNTITHNIIKTILEREHRHYLINAGPGSGKTTLLLELGKIMDYDEKVLFVSFNRQNVDRLKKEMGNKHSVLSTYALGLAQLRHFNPKTELDNTKYQKIWERNVELAALELDPFSQKVILQAFNYARLNLFNFLDGSHQTLLYLLESHPLDKSFEINFLHHTLKILFEAGVEEFFSSGGIDFPDMVALPYYVHDYYLNTTQRKPRTWRMIAIDEAQDLSRAQLELILLSSSGHVVLVGDEHQAVQGFAGALSNSIGQIRRRTKPLEMSLPVSYRCPISHLELINQIYPGARPRSDAPFGEIHAISPETYLSRLNVGDMVLARSNRYLIQPCLELQARGKHSKILGKDGAERMKFNLQTLEDQPGFSLPHLPEYIDQIISAERIKAGKDPKTLLHVSMLEDQYFALKLVYQAAGGPQCTRQDILKVIQNLFSETPEGIVFCTAHRSKGLESKRIFLLAPEAMPSKLALDQGGDAVVQEENLRYVALSRAKEKFYFICEDPSSVLHWIPEKYHEVWLERGVIDASIPSEAPQPFSSFELPARALSMSQEMYQLITAQSGSDPCQVEKPMIALPFSRAELQMLCADTGNENLVLQLIGLHHHLFKVVQQVASMEQRFEKTLHQLQNNLEAKRGEALLERERSA